jgi:hypothetical protein
LQHGGQVLEITSKPHRDSQGVSRSLVPNGLAGRPKVSKATGGGGGQRRDSHWSYHCTIHADTYRFKKWERVYSICLDTHSTYAEGIATRMRTRAAKQQTRASVVRLHAHREQCALAVTHSADVDMCVLERREGSGPRTLCFNPLLRADYFCLSYRPCI